MKQGREETSIYDMIPLIENANYATVTDKQSDSLGWKQGLGTGLRGDNEHEETPGGEGSLD